jgi:hypothetical protein
MSSSKKVTTKLGQIESPLALDQGDIGEK